MWFPRGDLAAVKDEVLPEMEWLDLDRWKEEAEFSASTTPNFCPACGDVALTRIRDRHSATEVDICPRCRGTWLGTGQFLNLVNALIDEANRTSAPEYVHISLQKAKEMLIHPSEIISEWKDFKTVLRMLKHRFFVENPTLESVLVGLQKSLPL
jgi:Zn-finger nucleic acid-binding protein